MASTRRISIVTVSFGTAVAMWALGYVCRLPGAIVPGALLLPLMLACLVAGGLVLGRWSGEGARAGAYVGLLTGVINLLILGSLLAGDDQTLVPSRLLWVPGALAVSAALVAAGAAIAPRARALTTEQWRTWLAAVGVVATLLVVVAGGIVTSAEEGLAVPDWPNSFGSNMFLFPLARMTGGIYYEHAHRLYGSLVGLTTIVVAVTMFATRAAPTLRWLAGLAVLFVIVQGAMGGLRVTGSLTTSMAAADLAPSLPLAIAHGVFGQVFLVVMATIWAMSTGAWRTAPAPSGRAGSLPIILVVLVLLQLVTGALARHLYTVETPMPWPTHVHLTLAALVAVAALVVGFRAWAQGGVVILRRIGLAAVVVVGLQLLLGFGALVVVLARREGGPNPVEIIVTTLHQANGALILVAAAQLALWSQRLGGAPVEAAAEPSVSPA
jgi:cytochrome c oxidase assembly protein subunit 15